MICRSHRRRGAATLEFAVLLPLLLLLIVAGVDFARVYYYTVTLTNCARNGAMYASQDDEAANDTSGIQAAALMDAENLSPAPKVTPTLVKDSAGHDAVEVTVSWSFETITRFPGVPSPITINRTVQMRVSPKVPKNSF